ncbi:hypothetical protein GCM10022419_135150 [Nonomuraea rosea]|uniref:Uncharacterized protein n=1 Tax=Nonomuraea rosea TaxID=638574 RepID=A0ABP7A821_9ACTN
MDSVRSRGGLSPHLRGRLRDSGPPSPAKVASGASEENPGLCYVEEPHQGSGMVDHLRGWYRGKKLIAFTLEPYHEVDADAFRAASPST